jgi:hypothetical protein
MIASRPWLGITKPEWLIKSDTPQPRGIQLVDRLDHKPRQMPLRKPLPHIRRQQNC